MGIHPDQATEALVDIALALGKPFAVVPCCVFPTMFPERRLRTGQSVRTYRGFIHYLRAKHPAIETARLPFEGRNRVLYWRGAQDPDGESEHCREQGQEGHERCSPAEG